MKTKQEDILKYSGDEEDVGIADGNIELLFVDPS